MTNVTNSHLGLRHHPKIPSEVLDNFCREVEAESLEIRRSQVSYSTPLASLELFLVPALAIYLFKDYFRGFLQEAGKDHYQILKKSLKRLWFPWVSNDNEVRIALLSADGETKTEYSLRFSIYVQIRNKRTVKLLLRETCSREEFEFSIDAFLRLIEAYQEEGSENLLEIDLDAEQDHAGHIFVVFDSQTEALRVVSPIPPNVQNPKH